MYKVQIEGLRHPSTRIVNKETKEVFTVWPENVTNGGAWASGRGKRSFITNEQLEKEWEVVL